VVLPQRGLTNLRVAFTDGAIDAKYAFPFWNKDWQVRLILLDRLGGPALVIPSPVRSASITAIDTGMRLEQARPLAEEPPEAYSGYFHLDPMWVLRGMLGPSEALRHALFRTNLAGKAKAGTEKLHDAEFDETLQTLVRLVTKDRSFVTRRYDRGNLLFSDLK